MSAENRNRVRKGVSTGGQFAVEARSEAAGVALSASAKQTPQERFEQSRLAGLKARFPEATDEEIQESAARLRQAREDGWDSGVLEELERQGEASRHGVRFAWDVKANIAEPDSRMSNQYPRETSFELRTAVEETGIEFRNSMAVKDAQTLGGEVILSLASFNRVHASLDPEDGSLRLRRSEEHRWIAASEGQSPAEFFKRHISKRVDFEAVDSINNHCRRGEVKGSFDDETGEANFVWSNGIHDVNFHVGADGKFGIDPDTPETIRTAFVTDFKMRADQDPLETIHEASTLAHERMLWHPDTEVYRHKHRQGPIRDHHESHRVRDKVNSRLEEVLPSGSFGTGRGYSRVSASTEEWYGEARVYPDGSNRFIIDGREQDGADSRRPKQVQLEKFVNENIADMQALAQASRRGLA